MITERMFPIQGERGRDLDIGGFVVRSFNRLYGEVPWGIAVLAYEVYAKKYGPDCQSLEILAKRGGFSWSELVWLLRGGEGQCVASPFAEPKKDED